MLSEGFVCPHYPYPTGLFNHEPQSYGLGRMPAGACIFFRNVAFISRLGLFSLIVQLQSFATQSHYFSGGLLKYRYSFLKGCLQYRLQAQAEIFTNIAAYWWEEGYVPPSSP